MSIEYHRKAPGRISPEADQLIRQELKREKDLVEDQRLPISSYNYTALRDRLQKKGLPFPSQRSSKGQRNRIVIGLAVNRRFMIARSSPAPLGK
jgi:hypothetical protein